MDKVFGPLIRRLNRERQRQEGKEWACRTRVSAAGHQRHREFELIPPILRSSLFILPRLVAKPAVAAGLDARQSHGVDASLLVARG